MKVLGRDKISEFSKKHAAAKIALDVWFSDAKSSEWKKPHDIKKRYNSADFLPNNRVIFNIKGNHFRLVVKVKYKYGIVVIEWVGTHAEYSKMSF